MSDGASAQRQGPLKGFKILEIAGIGPGPFCGMMLADMGADVLRIERARPTTNPLPVDPTKTLLHRGRRIVTLNLQRPEACAAVLKLVEQADALLEGYRPGVMERLGLGPDICLQRNPRLVYGRMTGWGQTGPLALRAGHDINYFSLSGSLWLSGRRDEVPSPNLNLVADMGGGGMLMAYGMVCAMLEAAKSGQGQVVDTAMFEGAALLATMIHGYRAMGRWKDERGSNILDSGAPFYEVYETSDGGYMAVGAIEPQFYAHFIRGLGYSADEIPRQHDQTQWPATKKRFAERFLTRTRAEWTAIFEDVDACATPVLTPDEAAAHPHAQARQSFAAPDGVQQPMPAPRFSRTPGGIAAPPPSDDHTGWQALGDWGLDQNEIDDLRTVMTAPASGISAPAGDAASI